MLQARAGLTVVEEELASTKSVTEREYCQPQFRLLSQPKTLYCRSPCGSIFELMWPGTQASQSLLLRQELAE